MSAIEFIQFGTSGVVLAVVAMFLTFLKEENKRDNERYLLLISVSEKTVEVLSRLSMEIHSLNDLYRDRKS